MTLVTLDDVLQPALSKGYAVGGMVTLGWEDMRAFVEAAEEEHAPVILQAGPSCRAHTPLPILGKMFRHLAENASVPVVAHLDHGYSKEECKIALDCGFTSLMFDGSRKAFSQNIDETAEIAEMAHASAISCEGEIGFVGYANGEHSAGTDPEEAAKFARDTNIDAMAISVGNVHLKQNRDGLLDETLIKEIDERTDLPLVIHGGSGVPVAQRQHLARHSSICKFNIGTELRLVFGSALRNAVNDEPKLFDRIEFLKKTHDPVKSAAQNVIRTLYTR